MNDSLPTEFLTSSLRTRKKATIAIYLMGQFRLLINNTDYTHLLTYDKVKLLLAVLALAQGRSVARTRLADMLWPDTHADKGRARVRHALHTLRQAFTAIPDALISDTTGLSLNSDLTWIDVLDIVNTPKHVSADKTKEILDHYTGPFLDGLKLPHSEQLLAWQQSWGARLDLELTQSRSRLIEQYLDQGYTQAALNHAKLWVYHWPEDEACHRLLIRLLLLSGDRDAALSAFHHCCDVLNKRLGVMPSTETRALLGLENQALSTQSLVNNTLARESNYRPMAIVAIALAWKRHESSANGRDNDDNDDDGQSEDAMDAICAWHERLLTQAQLHGAWLPQTGSTTILAHFGYPSLSERPIVHAIHLAKDLASLSTPANISVGLAIHADLALIDQTQEISLNGLLCQTVIPLAWDAEHKEILLSRMAAARMADWPIESVRRTGRHYIRLDPAAEPMPVGRMHGRLREFDTLIQQWTRHRRGHKPVTAQVTGASGLGKSQLLQAMAEYVRNVDGQVIALQSCENHSETPLHSILPWLRSQLDLPSTLSPSAWTLAQHEQTAQKIQHRFQLAPDASQALLDTLLNRGDALGDGYDTAINAALAALHHHPDTNQPVLITWDDIHWNDPSSNRLLQKIMLSEGAAITMLACTSRAPVLDATPVINLVLGPLEATTIAEYVVHRSRKSKLSRDIKETLVSESAGVPLYIKELLHLKALTLPAHTIPRVTDMLSAHLLRLNPDKRNLAYLAALLREVDQHTAAHILELDEDTVASGMDTLSTLGIVRRTSATHVTCNSLISRSIHRLMMRRIKQTLCEKIAHHMVREHQPAAVVARQLHHARSADTGVWWQRAIHDAMLQGSLDKAVEYITHALASGQYIRDPQHRQRFEFECNVTLGTLHAATSGPATPSAIKAYESAAQSYPSDDPAITMTVLWSQWVIQHNLGNLPASLHIARRLQQIALNQRHDLWHGWSLYALAQHDLWIGNPVASESLLLQALAAIHQDTGPEHPDSAFGSHSYALAYAALGWAQALQGRYNTALQNTQYAIQLASKNTSPTSATACKLHLLRIHYLANNFKSLQMEGTALLAQLPDPMSNNVWSAIVTAHAFLPLALTRPTENLIQTLSASLNVVQSNMPVATDGYLCMLARCQIAMGKPDGCMQLLNKASAIGQSRQSRLLTSEIHCIRGDAWVAMQRPDLAHQEWLKAKTTAQQCGLLAYDEWANERIEALAD